MQLGGFKDILNGNTLVHVTLESGDGSNEGLATIIISP